MQPERDDELVASAAGGSEDARARLLARYRPQLKRVIRARLDPRVSARVDSSDVVQEVLADAAGGLDRFLEDPTGDFYLWVRAIAERRVIDLHRRHIDAAKRTVRREAAPPAPPADATAGDGHAASQTSPSQNLVRAEELNALRAGLQLLSDDDREVIAMRYLEQLTLPEIAELLGITLAAAKSRHLRAVARLTEIVKAQLPSD